MFPGSRSLACLAVLTTLVSCSDDNDDSKQLGHGEWPFEPCAEVTESASLLDLSMFVTIDSSGSMTENNKWVDAKAAFTAFFLQPEADRLSIALRFWPVSPGCDELSCDANVCAQPQVPLGPLSDPQHEQALIDLFNRTIVAGRTPMSAALQGAAQWAEERIASDGDSERVAILLVTDGSPRGCDESIDNIASIAADALTLGIRTYAVGLLGSNETEMNTIAAAGGTSSAFFIGGTNTEAELLAALDAIRRSAISCSFPLPTPTDPSVRVDPELIGIRYTPQGIGDYTELTRTSGAAGCAGGDSWYYDNDAAPSLITLCTDTCERVQADETALLEYAVGCGCVTDADCAAGQLCIEGQCVTPCTTDADCREGLVCASDGSCVASFPEGAVVQGGAFECQVAATRDTSSVPGFALWGLPLVGLFAVLRRRATGA